ncbi:hypothetical protein CAPTEDRAFT_221444 [Capitella teleta]|uniref:VWFD domain-containing protein n=1 Tax=Capitella teleta TaxID=283909 RepID=R7U1D6_CAPTE|nr:hypothetical protein CAPTEDRAFT_221444 [Capitella teleta]|eukprot:ELT97461.1 hypothetical protein CAPTEDRAFT_221444 [Capitella teleta]
MNVMTSHGQKVRVARQCHKVNSQSVCGGVFFVKLGHTEDSARQAQDISGTKNTLIGAFPPFIFTLAIGECVCRGDPHCFAFDADRYNGEHELLTHNVCAYYLATDDCPGGLGRVGYHPTYTISALFERVKNISTTRSFVRAIEIQHFYADGDTFVNIMQGPRVTCSGYGDIEEFPKQIDGHLFEMVPAVFTHPKDFSKGVTEVLSYTLPNGVNVQYDGIKGMKINNDALDPGVPRCGLCGNDDGFYNDQDMMLGNNVNGARCQGLHADGQPHTVTSNKQHFVNSWFAFTTDDDACEEICPEMPIS